MAENPLDKIESPRVAKEAPPKKVKKKKDLGPKVPPQPDFDKMEMPSDEDLAVAQAEITEQMRERREGEAEARIRGSVSGGKNIVPEGGRGSRTERPMVPFQSKSVEGSPTTTEADPLTEAERKLKEAKESYEHTFGKAFTDRKWYQRILGVNVEKSEDVQLAREHYQRALDEFIKAKESNILIGLKSGQITAQEAEAEAKNFAKFIKADQIASLAQGKQKEAERQSEERGLIITKLSARWNEMIGKWRKLPLPVKAALSAGAFVVGGAGAVAAVGFIRILNGAVFGKAAQEYLQGLAEARRRDRAEDLLKQVGKEVESKIGDAEDRVKRVFGILGRDNAGLSKRLEKQAGGDIWKRWVGILAGVIAGSGILAKAVGWGYEHFWGKPSIGAIVPEGSGKGALSPDILETRPHGHVINSDENIWKVTRDIYSENPSGYGYDPSDPKIEKLFQSFRRQGLLGRMGIDADSFSDLSPEEKIKIWAENRTANSVNKLAEFQGGRVRDLVHAGDTVTVKPDGTIVFNDTSGIKAGYLSDVQGPKGAATYEPGGKRVVDIGDYEQRRSAAIARGLEADARLAEIRGPIAEKLAAEARGMAAIDNLRTQELMDFIQSEIYGPGTSVDWDGPAREFRRRMLGQFITSDHPFNPPSGISEKYWEAAQFLNEKLGPTLGNESTQEWLARGIAEKRISPEDVIRTLKRVVNK